MTRHIRLPLGPSTTATHCMDCPHMVGRHHNQRCTIYGDYSSTPSNPLRSNSCVQAEAKDGPQTYTARPRGKR